MSSNVYESLPPDRHTITLSPAAIMLKSAMALPTSPRKRAWRRLKLLEVAGMGREGLRAWVRVRTVAQQSSF